MATFTVDAPPQLTGDTRQDVAQLRQYMARLADRLRYTLNHMDSENLIEGGVKTKDIEGGGAALLAEILKDIAEAKIGKAAIANLRTQMADLVTATIRTAVIDWAHISDLEAEIVRVANETVSHATIQDAVIQSATIRNMTLETEGGRTWLISVDPDTEELTVEETTPQS